jgi:Fis family transcriptional regulator, factor for inversion stimulation protein
LIEGVFKNYKHCLRKHLTLSIGVGHMEVNHSENLFVANLHSVSLESLVKSKLEVLFRQQKEADVELNDLHKLILEQVEKPLIELSLKQNRGNQVKTAKLLGINRNTLKKKIDTFRIDIKNLLS